MTASEEEPDASAERPAKPSEALVVERIDELLPADARRILGTTPGLAQFARTAARQRPEAVVGCHLFDLHHAGRVRQQTGVLPDNLTLTCAADFPADEVDAVVLPLTSSGEADFVRDLLQSGHQRLKLDGRLIASTDNPDDSWLEAELGKLFDRVTRLPAEQGVVYQARKERPLKKVKNFASQFVFRDREHLIQAYSRPGVFAHRRVDAGARQLMNWMEISPGDRVVDLGCGSGVLALAAALRAEDVQVLAIDSNTRAVESTARGAELNGLTNVRTQLNADGVFDGAGTFQLALANPPYFANFRIARLFLEAARAALVPGGTIFLVTKLPEWYAEHMCEWFPDVEAQELKGYYVFVGTKSD